MKVSIRYGLKHIFHSPGSIVKNLATSGFLLVCCSICGCLHAQPGIQLGGGPGVGWMIYHRGLSQGAEPMSMGYDRTYVSLLLPAEGEIFWDFERIRIGCGVLRSVMFDRTMVGTTDRRGDRDRYRITPGDDNLLFEGIWISTGWLINPGQRIELRPMLRLGTFRSNTIHPAWNLLGPSRLFSPGVDISWSVNRFLSVWVCPQYFHVWRNDSQLSRPEESLHHHSIDIRAGIRIKWPAS